MKIGKNKTKHPNSEISEYCELTKIHIFPPNNDNLHIQDLIGNSGNLSRLNADQSGRQGRNHINMLKSVLPYNELNYTKQDWKH